MKLLAFAASHRKDSINRKLLTLAVREAEQADAKVDFVEYATFDMPIYDDEVARDQALPAPAQRFIAHLHGVDGLLLASPEYNWSFPGSLKNIIDWASVAEPNPFSGKTVLLMSASPSLRGGAQGLTQLGVPLAALGAHVFPRLYTLSRAAELFTADGRFADISLREELSRIVGGFMAMTRALRRA